MEIINLYITTRQPSFTLRLNVLYYMSCDLSGR